MQNLFGSNLKFLRLQRKLSQNRLAQKIGVNSTTIKRWEENTMSPNIESVDTIAKYFNISVSDLICRDLRLNSNINRVRTLKEFLEEITNSSLTDEEYDNIMEFIKNNKSLFIKDKEE